MAMPNQKQYALIQIIKKIRVFERLDIEEIVSLLKVCKTRTYPEKQRIYQAGDPSREMLILLKGHLQVTSDTEQILAEIPPGRCVGEMGLFTGGKRSANIIAREPSMGLVLDQRGLVTGVKSRPGMYTKILENVIAVLSERLGEANRRSRGH